METRAGLPKLVPPRKGAYFLLACFAVGIWGCERVALLPRQDVDRHVANRDSIERRGDIRERDYSHDRHDEVVGTLQRVDESNREIHLLTTEGRKIVVKYDDDNTQIYRRDRVSGIHSLRYGDLVLIRMITDSRGERYADLIRADERPEFGSRR